MYFSITNQSNEQYVSYKLDMKQYKNRCVLKSNPRQRMFRSANQILTSTAP